jgi:hypothetical protein
VQYVGPVVNVHIQAVGILTRLAVRLTGTGEEIKH